MYAILMMKLLFYYSLYDKTPRKVFTGQRAANNNGALLTLPFYPFIEFFAYDDEDIGDDMNT